VSWWAEFLAIVLGDLVAAVLLFLFLEKRIEEKNNKRRSTETRTTLKAIALRQKEWAEHCIKIKDATRLPKHPARDYGLQAIITNFQNWGFDGADALKAKAHELFSELEKWEEYRNNGGHPDRIGTDDQMRMLNAVVKLSGELDNLADSTHHSARF